MAVFIDLPCCIDSALELFSQHLLLQGSSLYLRHLQKQSSLVGALYSASRGAGISVESTLGQGAGPFPTGLWKRNHGEYFS